MRKRSEGEENRLYPEDRAVHDWYRFVLSFPPHLVRDYLERFGVNSCHQVLDPFCGTGTVLVEHARRIAEAALEILRSEGIEDEALFNGTQNEHCTLRMLPAEEMELLL